MTVSIKKIESQSAPNESSALTFEASGFDVVFNTHWPRVYGVVYRVVGDSDEAQDLALDTFLRLHQRPPRRETNLSGWLFRVATNLAFNALRSRKRREGYEKKAGVIALEREAVVNPGKEIERAEECRRVRQVLSKMKVRSAKILILRYSGFSYDEIAAAVGIAVSSVGTLLGRAEREFEKHFERE